jgi:hypothetical protein
MENRARLSGKMTAVVFSCAIGLAINLVMFNRSWLKKILGLAIVFCLWLGMTFPAGAMLEDDRYDGDIFALYAGNGSIVPPKSTLANSLKMGKPTVVVYYLDDSKDCKTYSLTVSRIQEFYGRAMDISPIRVDSLPLKATYEPNEAGFYYRGFVPQTVIFDAKGKVQLDEVGNTPYEKIDDTLRSMFDLEPRDKSEVLTRRRLNDVNMEMSK